MNTMSKLISAQAYWEKDEDQISTLPDDIIFNVLSPMEMKEAAKTSILSKRWRYCWAMRTHLDFNHTFVFPKSDPNAFPKSDPNSDCTHLFTAEQKGRYIEWVNQVVALHCGPCIDTFRVSFIFNNSDCHHIDKWVRFALLKKVKNLELSMFSQEAVYTINFDIVKLSLGITNSSMSLLKSICLRNINVSGDILEYMLTRWCLLEELHVHGSETLVRLKVVGLSCKLKKLAIRNCHNLEEFEIDALHLINLDYVLIKHSTNFVFKSMPMLVEASFGVLCFDVLVSIYRHISHLAAQISKLSLDMMYCTLPTGVPTTFSNLKHLTLLVNAKVTFLHGKHHVAITRLLEACPVLHEFKIEYWEKDEDQISTLPDDIIFNVLSPMEMKEAAKTSILSKRWRYCWAMRTHLDFNHTFVFPKSDPNAFPKSDPNSDCTHLFTAEQKGRYIEWVNQVVALHCGPCIDTFRVSFIFNNSDCHHIDKWVRFALLKKVKNLELSMFSQEAVYTINFDIVKLSLGITNSSMSLLKSICLRNINVSGDILEYMLTRWCLLEELHVHGSETLVRLKVVGLSCKLKKLAIRNCHNLEEFEIDALHLINLDYVLIKHSTNFVFKSMPMLVEASFGVLCFDVLVSIYRHISHLAAQISKLSLDMMYCTLPTGVPTTFSNLKHLTLLVNAKVTFLHGKHHVAITRLLEACPVLHEFKIEISWSSDDWEVEAAVLEPMDLDLDLDTINVVQRDVQDDDAHDVEYLDYLPSWYLDYLPSRQMEHNTHQNLKLLHVVGFNGCNYDVEFILWIIDFACKFETLICDSNRYSYDWLVPEAIEASKIRARKLVKLVPSNVSVVVI